jgi:membrane associated rhomboid family serine protease
MLIVGDESQSRGKTPWVTFSIVVINILAYCAQCFLGPSFTYGFSLVPKEITTLTDLVKPERVTGKVPYRVSYENGKQKTHYREVTVTVPHAPGPFPIFLTLFTSMFLHGSFMHLLGNMWFLVVFGRNVECALDHGRFLFFYLACGLGGAALYITSDAYSVIPCLGASGAISGVLGAYVAIHPFNLISLWFGLYIGVIRLPAFVVVGVWFYFQYLGAFESLEVSGTKLGGTAYWDHIGGFFTGVIGIWGMVAYLKWQKQTLPDEEDLPVQTQTEAADSLGSYLPPSKPVARADNASEARHASAVEAYDPQNFIVTKQIR